AFAERRDYVSLGIRPVHVHGVFVAPVQSVREPVCYRIAHGILCRCRYQAFFIITLDFLQLVLRLGLGLSAGLASNPLPVRVVADRYFTSPAFPLVIPVQAPFATAPACCHGCLASFLASFSSS